MTETLILGVPIVVLAPGLVEVLKKCGLPARYAGLAAIGCAALLAALADVAGLEMPGSGLAWPARLAAWALAGIVYGLAAAGLYAQGKTLAAGRGGDA
ncbi:MAG: hypothetical protein IT338_04765 [Thermomicrobiales bacterium]|nr:hypothetical protein [Thermomicrobiales bacterium]